PAASSSPARRGPAAVLFHPLSQRAEMPSHVAGKKAKAKSTGFRERIEPPRCDDAARRQDCRRRGPGSRLQAAWPEVWRAALLRELISKTLKFPNRTLANCMG
ncbi:MAG: hypothetical protein ACK56I_12740, partial [bacterium]